MEPSKALIEAGARALVSSLCVYIDMDAPNMQHQADYYRRIAADVLRSAMGGVEVVYTNTSNGPVDVMTGSVFRVCTLPNDRIVLLRAEVE